MMYMSGISDAKHYAGFPVGGQFLVFESTALTRWSQRQGLWHSGDWFAADVGAAPRCALA